MHRFLYLVIVIVSVGLSGCSTVSPFALFHWDHSEATRAPGSSVMYEKALAEAREWQQRDPSRRLLQVSNTGSMEPFFGANAIVGIEPVKTAHLRPNDIISYRSGNVEKVHQVEGFNRNGVVTHGQRGWTTETVPYGLVTGRMATVFYFDRTAARSVVAKGNLPVGFASDGIPADGIFVLQARMLTAGPIGTLFKAADGYLLDLQRDAAVRLSVGPQGTDIKMASTVDIAWSPRLAGLSKKFSIFDQMNPDAGTLLINVNYGR